jgi:hypothetical protein
MNEYTDGLKETKTIAVANQVAQRKSRPALQLVDNRPGAAVQLKLQEGITNSPRVQQLKARYNSHTSIDADDSAVIQRRLNYSKYSGYMTMFSSYTETEIKLNTLEQKTLKDYNLIHNYQKYPLYESRVLKLHERYTRISTTPIAESEYGEVEAELNEIDAESLEIAQAIADSKRSLNKELTEKFNVVEGSTKAVDAPQNTLTKEEFKEIKGILEKIYLQGSSVISVQLESGEHFNLAARADELTLPIPDKIKTSENKIRETSAANTIRDQELDVQIEEAMQIVGRPKFAALKEEQRLLWENLIPLKAKYLEYVRQYVRDETMKDLVKIAQTGIGRDLLKEMADEKYRDNMKVVIAVRDFYGAPTGGPTKGGGGPKVTYTPQALKDRDTLNRGDGKAITRMEALKGANPWQENARTDTTLFHELVHAHHVQNKTLLDKDDLVAEADVTHAADKPFAGSGLAAGQQIGVPKEEYQTVGLGAYAGDGFNENTYRKQRRAMGEEVANRPQYTHIDDRGGRVGDESAM